MLTCLFSLLARAPIHHRRKQETWTSGLLKEEEEVWGHRGPAGHYLTACPMSAGQASCCLKMNRSLAMVSHSNQISGTTWGPKVEISIFWIRCAQFHYHSKKLKAKTELTYVSTWWDAYYTPRKVKNCWLCRHVKRFQ